MSKNLVIVESPAKAKTIEGYLGKDYKVLSSYGHVRDLPKGNNAIDIENGFTPTYEITKDKKEVVKALMKEAKNAEMIYLATDDDREGEAISWHLKEALKLDDARIKRIVFREITKSAIQNAINSPKGIDIDLVNAQQARRILDRLVGFELSPILWKKIKTGLSAGRVQSVAVRIVVEREREIDKFNAESFYKIQAFFNVSGNEMKAELPGRFKKEEEAMAFLEKCLDAEFSIGKLEKKPGKKSPAPPFTTSTLQQEASRKLGFSVSQTMTLAQRLYESGKISYMRTDSLNLSDEAKQGAAKEINTEYGSEYSHTRTFKTKSAGAQEAHEAIRPTNFAEKQVSSDYNEQRLYDLIWKRAIASQMSDAQIEKTNVSIDISNMDQTLSASGEVVKFEGFLKVYIESTDDEDEGEGNITKGMLPPLQVGQALDLKRMQSREGFTRPAARYNEATLVKKLEELGIGRPSTYAPTISTIQKRGYVNKELRDGNERKYVEMVLEKGKITRSEKTEITGAEKNKLFPSNLAMVVNDFLVEHFPNVTDFNFTAKVEHEFDEIAKGKKVWNHMIKDFYGDFHNRVDQAESIERKDINTGRELGVDPKTGKNIIVRLGKFGPLVQLGDTPDPDDENAEKPTFASLRKGQFIENITLEDALELFKLPRELGDYEEQKVVAAIGRFGPYIRHDGKFVSIPKGEDPLDISLERSIELIEEKRKADREKFIKSFDEDPEVQVLNGRWGPYIKFGKKNVKIPKDQEPADLTYKQCVALAEATPDKKGGKKAAPKKAAPKKAAAKKTAPKKKK